MTRRTWDPDDPERRIGPPDLGPLFGPPAQPWPEVPPRGDSEQLTAPVGGTIQADFEAWLTTDAGRVIYREFCAEALGQVTRGATRLSAKGIWETIRSRLKQSANNSYVSLVARQAEQEYPVIRGLFEFRVRRAS